MHALGSLLLPTDRGPSQSVKHGAVYHHFRSTTSARPNSVFTLSLFPLKRFRSTYSALSTQLDQSSPALTPLTTA
jgi:hypothetical protein